METSPLIYSANQWVGFYGFYIIETSVMKEVTGTSQRLSPFNKIVE